jgi:hypothetical protein
VDAEAYRLRVGELLTIDQVAERMGCSHSTAVERCKRAERRYAARNDASISQARARQERRYESLLSRLAREWTGPLTEKQAATMASVISKIDRLWGLDRSPPAEQVPTVIAKHATITALDPAVTRALLGRDPIPIPGRAPIEVEAPLLVENDAPSEPPEGEARGNCRAT